MRKIGAVLLVLMLLASAGWYAVNRSDNTSNADDCIDRLPAQTQVTSTYVMPDDGYAPVLSEIDGARCSIDLSMYLLSDKVIIDSLIRATNRGVQVRVILERSPFNSYGGQEEVFQTLVDAGVEARWSPDHFQYTHAKYMIVDRQSVILGNQNFTGAGFNSNREFGVVSTDSEVVLQSTSVFDADWNSAADVLGVTSLIVSPVNARARILELINSADTSVWMYAEVLRDDQFTQALDRASARGVDVRLIVNASVDEDDAPYFLDAMQHGVKVRVQDKPYVHAKLIIVDGDRALIGSHNYSSTSLDKNREVGMIVSDPDSISRLTDIYLTDWQKATPVDAISNTDPGLTMVPAFGSISSGRWGVV